MCRAGSGGLSSSEPIQLSHFVCRAGSSAISARIGTLRLVCTSWLESASIHAPGSRCNLRPCQPPASVAHARAGVTVQLIAVGLATGDVALHKLYGWGRAGRRSNDTAYAEPLRILSM